MSYFSLVLLFSKLCYFTSHHGIFFSTNYFHYLFISQLLQCLIKINFGICFNSRPYNLTTKIGVFFNEAMNYLTTNLFFHQNYLNSEFLYHINILFTLPNSAFKMLIYIDNPLAHQCME